MRRASERTTPTHRSRAAASAPNGYVPEAARSSTNNRLPLTLTSMSSVDAAACRSRKVPGYMLTRVCRRNCGSERQRAESPALAVSMAVLTTHVPLKTRTLTPSLTDRLLSLTVSRVPPTPHGLLITSRPASDSTATCECQQQSHDRASHFSRTSPSCTSLQQTRAGIKVSPTRARCPTPARIAMPKLAVLLAALVLALATAAAAPIAYTDWRDLARRALTPPVESPPRPRQPVVKSLRGRRVVIDPMPVRPGG